MQNGLTVKKGLQKLLSCFSQKRESRDADDGTKPRSCKTAEKHNDIWRRRMK